MGARCVLRGLAGPSEVLLAFLFGHVATEPGLGNGDELVDIEGVYTHFVGRGGDDQLWQRRVKVSIGVPTAELASELTQEVTGVEIPHLDRPFLGPRWLPWSHHETPLPAEYSCRGRGSRE